MEREIGERRVISFHGVGLSVAPEISFSEVTAASENPEEVWLQMIHWLCTLSLVQIKMFSSKVA